MPIASAGSPSRRIRGRWCERVSSAPAQRTLGIAVAVEHDDVRCEVERVEGGRRGDEGVDRRPFGFVPGEPILAEEHRCGRVVEARVDVERRRPVAGHVEFHRAGRRTEEFAADGDVVQPQHVVQPWVGLEAVDL